MAKEKVTLTLDSDQLAELRALVGARSLSSTIDGAVAAQLGRLRHLRAVDEWLAELDDEHGSVAEETLEWAGRAIDSWTAATSAGRRAG